MNIKSLGLALFFFFSIASTVSAQQFLSLEQCRQLAIENNKSLKIASEQERIAYYEKKDALTKFFPDISFVGGYLHNQKNLYLIPSSAIPTSIPLPIEIPGIGNNIPIDDKIRNSIHDLGKVDIKNVWAG